MTLGNLYLYSQNNLIPSLAPESQAPQPFDDTTQAGEYKLVTILVGRLTGAQSLEPEALYWLHQAFARLVLTQVQQDGGTVQQYLGDGVVALFGVPVTQEVHVF